MIFELATGFYIYIIIKACSSRFTKTNFFKSFEIYIFEIISQIVLFTYLANFFFIKKDVFNSFIISESILSITFLINIILLGCALGLNIAKRFIKNAELISDNFKNLTDLSFTLVLNFFFFLICLLEASKTNLYAETENKKLILLALNSVVGLILGFINSKKLKSFRLINGVTLFVISLSLASIILESNTNLILTMAFLFYSVAYLSSSLLSEFLSFIKPKKFHGTEESISELGLKENIKPEQKREDKVSKLALQLTNNVEGLPVIHEKDNEGKEEVLSLSDLKGR